MRHIYAKIETNFLHDARMRSMTANQQIAYLALWLLAVETGSEDLSPEASTLTYLKARSGMHEAAVKTMLRKAEGFTKPLVRRRQDGGLTVCGVSKLHPKLFIKKSDTQENTREHKRREEGGVEERTAEDTTAEPEQPAETPPLAALAAEAKKQPWPANVPWMLESLFWFKTIPQAEDFAVKILDLCLASRGIPWPHLQEKLLDSSWYLESHQAKYKQGGARAFYWHQVERYENKAPDPPAPKRDNGSRERKWPAGATRFQDGKFFDVNGEVIPNITSSNIA